MAGRGQANSGLWDPCVELINLKTFFSKMLTCKIFSEKYNVSALNNLVMLKKLT